MLNKLVNGYKLTNNELKKLFEDMMTGKLNDIQIASYLTSLKINQPSVEELLIYLDVLKNHANKIHLDMNFLVDTCGTGGDNSNTFNISTAVAFVVAGANVNVAKHGNKSASSKCGSADILEELGVNITTNPKRTQEIIKKIGIGFMFAPIYHQAFKNVAHVRKQLGFRTIFNFFGPLLNPANVKRQIIGVYDPELTELMANLLKNLGSIHALVVHGNGLDEFTIDGKTKVTELKNNKINSYFLDAKDFNLSGDIREVKGGSIKINKKIILDVLNGKKGPARNIVVLNSAAAIYVSGKVDSIKNGIKLAENSIDSGFAINKLNELVQESNS